MHYSLLVAALVLGASAHAVTVYKSVDAEGKISYSDQPPTAGQQAEKIDIHAYAPLRSAEDAARLQAMRDTTELMRRDRLEREQQRYQEQASAPYTGYVEYEDSDSERTVLYPVYRPRYPYRPGHPGHYPGWPAKPQPLPSGSEARSPRGLQARLREAR